MERSPRRTHDHEEPERPQRSLALWRDRRLAADVLLCAILLLSPLARATVHLWSTLLLALLTALLALTCLRRRGEHHPGHSNPFHFGPLGWILVAASLYPLLQLVPLPPKLIQLLSPAAWELRDADGGWTSRWQSIAIEPADTALVAVRRIISTIVFLVVANRYADRTRRRVLLGMVTAATFLVIVGGVFDLVTRPPLGTELDDMGSRLASLRMRGTFVNANHAASYFVIGAMSALALTAGLSRPILVAAAALVATLASAATLLTWSRAGIIAFAVGGICLLVFLIVRSAVRRSLPRRTFVAWAILMLGSTVAFSLVEGPLRTRFADFSLLQGPVSDTKFRLQGDSLAVLSDFGRTGMGEGGFGQVYARYRTLRDRFTFTHVENEYLDQIVNYGFLFGLGPPLAILVLGVAAAVRRRKSTTMPFVVAALLACAVHGLADFGMVTGGVSVTFFALLGLLLAPSGHARRSSHAGPSPPAEAPPPASTARRPLLLPLGALGVASASALLLAPRTLAADTGRVTEAARGADPASFERVASAAAARHPADYLIPLVAAQYFASRDLRQALRWNNRALFLAPQSPDAHLMAARLLVRARRARQAMVEYGLALRSTQVEHLEPILREVWALRQSPDDILAVTRNVNDAAAFLGRLSGTLPKSTLERFAAENPADPAPLRTLARRALEESRPKEAQAYLERARALDGGTTESDLLEFDLLLAQGKAEQGRARLRHRLDVDPGNTDIMLRLAEDALSRGDYAEVHRQAQDIWLTKPHSRGLAARAFSVSAQAFEKAGKGEDAIREYRRARAMDEGLGRQLAEALERAGQLGKALEEWKRIAEAEGPSSDAREHVRDLERRTAPNLR